MDVRREDRKLLNHKWKLKKIPNKMTLKRKVDSRAIELFCLLGI